MSTSGNKPTGHRPDRSGTARDAGRSSREYGHSSGDRNTRRDEDDAPSYRDGGTQRDAGPDDRDRLEP